MVRLQAQIGIDPLPPEEWGERSDINFPYQLGARLNDWDFLTRVPPPDAEVDLAAALDAFDRDLKHGHAALEGGPMTLEALLAVMVNTLEWCRFMAVRWPSPEGREIFFRLAGEYRVKIDLYGPQVMERKTA